jgi:hypothetical protein
MPGPPPKDPDQRARRNATVAMTTLPAAGRQGPPPKWPLPGDLRLATAVRLARAAEKDARLLAEAEGLAARERAKRDRELAHAREKRATLEAEQRAQKRHEVQLWATLWSTPMAVEWERLGWTREVALYVRFQVLGELGDRKAAAEARLRAASLGLTPRSLLDLRWKIADVPTGQEEKPPQAGSRARYRHLRPVEQPPATG